MAEPIPPGPPTVHVRAPAKINLTLRVGEPRRDGFHPLATVYQAVSLYEDLYARLAEPGVFELEVLGEGADEVPTDRSNLALQAAELLAAEVGEPVGVSITIEKSVPVAAGLAGGSADAAAALVGCAAIWDLDVTATDLLPLAAQLGSDVPFALIGGTAVGSGRGESVVPAMARGSYHWVLAFADHGLSTPAVYRRYDELGPTPPDPFQVPDGLMNALLSANPARLGQFLINDLQAPAIDLRPELQTVLDAGRDLGAVGAVISGSGPTCAFLTRDDIESARVAEGLAGTGLCRAVHQVTGPVAGARIVG